MAFRVAAAAAVGFTIGELLGLGLPLPSLADSRSAPLGAPVSRSQTCHRLRGVDGGGLHHQPLRFADIRRPTAEFDPHGQPFDLSRILGFGSWSSGGSNLPDDHIVRAVDGRELARSCLCAGTRPDRRQYPRFAAYLSRPCAVPAADRAAAKYCPNSSRKCSRDHCTRQHRGADEPVRVLHGQWDADQHHRDHGDSRHHSSAVGCCRTRGSGGSHCRKYRWRPCRDHSLSADLAAALSGIPSAGRAFFWAGSSGPSIAAGGSFAPIAAVGTATFLVVLGLGLSPLPQDSGTLFLARISTVIVASLYTIGIASVLRGIFAETDKANLGSQEHL